MLRQEPIAFPGLSKIMLDAATLLDLERHQLVGLLELVRSLEDPEFELVVRRAEPLLGFLELGDVELHPLPVHRPAVVVSNERGNVAEPDRAPVARDEPVFATPRLPRLVVQIVCGERVLTILGMQELHPDVRLLEPLLARVAERHLDLWADVQRLAVVVGCDDVDDGRHVLDERAVARLGGPERLLRALGRRDVVHHAVPADRPAVPVPDGNAAVARPDHLTVRPDHAVILNELGPRTHGLEPRLVHA
jgi:hypothetical protein